jgi:DNA processing protein
MILRIPGLKAEEKAGLSGRFTGEEDLAGLSRGDLEEILGRPLRRFVPPGELRLLAERDEKAARIMGIRWVSLASPDYPPGLRDLPDPPVLIFYRGTLPEGGKPAAAMVGTRRPHGAALRAAFEIGRDLGRQGVSVVSGLALGIDAAAHRGNVEGGGRSYAVLGSGADEVYPSSNRPLARRILETGGGILSEYPPGTGPQRWHFPERNRLISALARGTLIVEAPAVSGALITARITRELGRKLWVADLASEGAARLAEEGAAFVSSASDMTRDWDMDPAVEDRGGEDSIGRTLAASLARELTIG